MSRRIPLDAMDAEYAGVGAPLRESVSVPVRPSCTPDEIREIAGVIRRAL